MDRGDRDNQQLEPDDWAQLSAVERARRCRAMASEAQQLSKGAEGEIRNIYFALSLHWLALANEIEQRHSEPAINT
jgi:hypothetical protein